jgi:uncharacterized protein (DUF1697 family)
VARYVAFLRAINVGGRTVKMEHLRSIFADAGVTNVESFIASGNVLFDSVRKSEAALRKLIESELQEKLGFPVATFLRSAAEVKQIAAHEPFAKNKYDESSRLFVGLLHGALAPDATERLTAHNSKSDEFQVNGREVYWLCHVPWSDSAFAGPRFEKTLGCATTVRNINMLQRLAAKLV